MPQRVSADAGSAPIPTWRVAPIVNLGRRFNQVHAHLSARRVPTRLQYQTTECGVAALAMILAYHGRHVPMEDIRRVTGVSRDCLNAADMVRAGRHYGLECSAYSREPDDLRRMSFPFVVHVRFIHFVVVEGMTADRVLVNDPACGRSEIPIEQFDESFTGIVITFRPGPTFQPGGHRDRLFRDLWQSIDGGTASLLALAALTAVLTPFILVHTATTIARTESLWPSGIAIIGILLALRGALHLGQALTLEAAYRRLSGRQSESFLHTLVRRSFAYLSYRMPSEQVKSVYDIDLVARLLCKDLFPALLTLPAVVIIVGALFQLNTTVGTVALALAVLNMLCLTGLSYWRGGDARKARQSGDEDFRGTFDRLVTIESNKVAGMDRDYVAADMGRQAQTAIHEQRDATACIATATVSRSAQLGTVLATAALAGGAQVTGTLDAGGLISCIFLACALAHAMQDWPRLRGKGSSLHHALLRRDDLGTGDETTPQEPATTDASLYCKNVVFGHSPTRPPLLDGVDFEFRTPAEQVGITGRSGGGKSTFAAVAAGLYAPWSGTLETGPHVTWIDKSPFLFDGTVRENLLLWRDGIDDAALWRALRDACLDDVIAACADGLDTVVVARGRNFSGGQRQRLEIARALTFDPNVLILDEALDALNPALETQLRANLRRRGCALMIVSHRTSTLEACDRVLHFSNGRLSERHEVDDNTEDLQRTGIEALFAATVATRRAPTIDMSAASVQFTRGVRYLRREYWRQPHLPLLGRRRNTDEVVHLAPYGDGYKVEGTDRNAHPDDFHELLTCLYPTVDFQTRTPPALCRAWVASSLTELSSAAALSLAMTVGTIALAVLMSRQPAGEDIAPEWKVWLSLGGGLLVIGLLTTARQGLLLRIEQRARTLGHLYLSQRLIRTQAWFLRAVAPERLGRALSEFHRMLERLRIDTTARILDATMIGGGCLALGWFDVRIGLTALAFTVVGLLWEWRLARRLGALQARVDARHRSAYRFLLGMMRSVARLRAVGGHTRAADHWRAMHREALIQSERLGTSSAIGWAFRDVWLWSAFCVLVWTASSQFGGTWQMCATLLLTWQVLAVAHRISGIVPDARKAVTALSEIQVLMDAPLDPVGAKPAAAFSLELTNVGFGYAGTTKTALEDVSLRLNAGDIVAIAGPSGSGKSTLLRILLGFENPSSGTLNVDGRDLKETDAAFWRQGIGVVQQDDHIDTASTLRGIISGYADVDIDDVWRAAELALLGDDIKAMPMGMQTIVEHGKLSTGQEQRLLIARQLLRRPSLLILDEATNAISEDMQSRIFANLRAAGIGMILATHRKSAIAAADRVIVLDRGRLVWEGVPAAFAANSMFSDILRRERLAEGDI